MIDWKNAEEFNDLPLLPQDFTWPELKQVIGEGKQIGPLFHYSGFLPYTMQTVKKYPNCPLRNIVVGRLDIVPYIRTFVQYDGTFGASDQGQTLDV